VKSVAVYKDKDGRLLELTSLLEPRNGGLVHELSLKRKRRWAGAWLLESAVHKKSSSWESSLLQLMVVSEKRELLGRHGVELPEWGLPPQVS